VAKANIRKRPDICHHFEVNPKSRVKEAHINFRSIQNKPVAPFEGLPKLKEHNDSVVR
jgi:hypothetical protein